MIEFYYEVAIISSPLEPLTYSSTTSYSLGDKVLVNLRNKEQFGVIVKIVDKPDFKTLEIKERSEFYYSSKQIELARFISSYYICSLGDSFGILTPFSKNFTCKNQTQNIKTDINLTKTQQEAFEFLQNNQTALLFGDTGSGKTEIYIKLFEDIINKGKKAIFLLPEISLTPQMENRLKKHFDDKVIMWHSKLTKKQKQIALEKIYSEDFYIVAGPRSALFLPINNLGIIIVDEEHDESYKSNKRPRYNAKDLAIYMGKLYDVKVVLGSATPTLQSYKKFPSFRLKEKFFKSDKKFIYENSIESLTPQIYALLEENLKKKEQSIVFLPTRANFKHIVCKDCGESFKCVYCNVGMSLHVKLNALKCHYCGFMQSIPKVCDKCGSEHLVSSRLGTAEVVKELRENFSDAVIEQFDRDNVTTQTKLKKILKRFNDKEIDILVGTQMLSKGHDYHGVTLAIVLGMDNMLNMPDYKAREKALSSLIQISGRSGRKHNSKVLIQTFNKEFFETYINDYDRFLEDEKFFREGLYPPYKKLARILFAHKNYTKAKEQMLLMKEKLMILSDLVEIVGSGECGINKVANKYRFEILLRSQKATNLIKAIKASLVDLAEVDMDPLEFS